MTMSSFIKVANYRPTAYICHMYIIGNFMKIFKINYFLEHLCTGASDHQISH